MMEPFIYELGDVINLTLKVGLATIAGLLIGLEREFKEKGQG